MSGPGDAPEGAPEDRPAAAGAPAPAPAPASADLPSEPDPAAAAPDGPAPAQADARRLMPERHMLESLVCPITQGRLDWDRKRQELVSRSARLAYPVRDGVPIMLPSEARKLDG